MFGTDFSLADPRLRRPSFRRPAAEDAFSAAAFLEGVMFAVVVAAPIWAVALIGALR